jgi:hypothetical protein
MAVVVNRTKEREDLYIGRGTIWGNPYRLENDTPKERDRVISLYSEYLWGKIALGEITVEMLLSLDGKKLGCWCKPKACHGDVLASAVAWAKTINTGVNVNEEL